MTAKTKIQPYDDRVLTGEQADTILHAAHEIEAVVDEVFGGDPPEWLAIASARLHAIRQEHRMHGGLTVAEAREFGG